MNTTKPGQHTILHMVTDTADLTSTSTRTLIVSAPANDARGNEHSARRNLRAITYLTAGKLDLKLPTRN